MIHFHLNIGTAIEKCLFIMSGGVGRDDFHTRVISPSSNPTAGNGSVMTGVKASPRASVQMPSTTTQPVYSTPNQPFEDVLLRQRTLGQDIIPSPREPKRTESLYTPQKPMPSGGGGSAAASSGGGFFKSSKLKVCSVQNCFLLSFFFIFLWFFAFS